METNLKRGGEEDDETVPLVKKTKIDSEVQDQLDHSKDIIEIDCDNSETIKDDNGKDEENTDMSAGEQMSSTKPLTEEQAGISEYMGTHLGFSAIIKQRYSDFIVNEIDQNGKTIHLTGMSYDKKEEEDEDDDNATKNDEMMKEILSSEDIAAITAMVESKDKTASHSISAPEDKELRTKIHLAVKKSFAQLETKTSEDESGTKIIQVVWRTGKSRDAFEWPKSKRASQYIRFVLFKENKDTMDVIALLAKNLKVKDGLFQYAGTKDKRAKTSQEITVHRVHPKKLCALNKVLWSIGLGDFRYVKDPLKLGQLSGNHFTIVLRNVQGSQECIDECLSSFQSKGFINYFGMQRFGTTSIPTHRIGWAMLLGDWDQAVDLILKPRQDLPIKDKFQQVWAKTKDADATLKVTPRFCSIERKLLESLSKKMKSFNAIERLPRNTRLLYLHSYQSYVWNRMTSRRLKQLGHQVVVGDLVMKDSSSSSPITVTQENLNEFSMKDVILPLPGHDVVYPGNEVADWYREVMKEDGLDIDEMKRPQKDYSLSGAYRHLVVLARDVSWSHQSYDDYTLPLTESDYDVLKETKLPPTVKSGKYQAVILHLSLPSSCYATMALRECMKIDTSSFHQASLNVT